MKGAMLGKLFVDVSDGGITTTEWKVGRVVDITAITVTAPDGTRQVNTRTVKWRETVAVTNTTSHRVTGDVHDLHICIDSLGATREWLMVEQIPAAKPSSRPSGKRKRNAK